MMFNTSLLSSIRVRVLSYSGARWPNLLFPECGKFTLLSEIQYGDPYCSHVRTSPLEPELATAHCFIGMSCRSHPPLAARRSSHSSPRPVLRGLGNFQKPRYLMEESWRRYFPTSSTGFYVYPLAFFRRCTAAHLLDSSSQVADCRGPSLATRATQKERQLSLYGHRGSLELQSSSHAEGVASHYEDGGGKQSQPGLPVACDPSASVWHSFENMLLVERA